MPPQPQEVIAIAYRYARQLGLSREDAEDCAMDFRLHLLRSPGPQVDSEGWIRRCAYNYACNYLRSQMRRLERERDLAQKPQSIVGRSASSAFAIPGPRTLTLRKALWEQIFATLKEFTPEQRDLFLRYHVRQQSWQELTQRTGRSAHALQQALYHIHQRLARLLLARGWSARDAAQLFVATPQPCPRRKLV